MREEQERLDREEAARLESARLHREVAERRERYLKDEGHWICGFCEAPQWPWREVCYHCGQEGRDDALKRLFPDPPNVKPQPVKEPPPNVKPRDATTFYPAPVKGQQPQVPLK